jgi:hypothetical protein
VSVPLCFALAILTYALKYNRAFRRLREQERLEHPECYEGELSTTMNTFRDYRSRARFLGLPLIHVRSGVKPGGKAEAAVGWIAIGDRAIGVLFAAGGVAIGGISMGGVSVGLIALGGASAGLLALGGFAVGLLALGGAAVGFLAAGGIATAWKGASGGLAIAHEFAIGGQTLAQHANDAAARVFFSHYSWMDISRNTNRTVFTFLCWLPVLLSCSIGGSGAGRLENPRVFDNFQNPARSDTKRSETGTNFPAVI